MQTASLGVPPRLNPALLIAVSSWLRDYAAEKKMDRKLNSPGA